MIDNIGALVVLALAALVLAIIVKTTIPSRVKSFLVAGLILRLLGSQIYFYLSEWLYGFGDYSTYYSLGLDWGDAWLLGTTANLHSAYLTEWCCTGFLVRFTGLLLIVLGPTVNGAFLTYSLFGYAGIVAFVLAFARAFPSIPVERYLVWVAFFPSLWYWPAALGKDSLILGGMGLIVLGFVGKRGRTSWVVFLAGLAVVFIVRPQVAVVAICSLLTTFWISRVKRISPMSLLQGFMLITACATLAVFAGDTIGLSVLNPGEVESYLARRSEASGFGGSAVDSGLLFGVINVLFRPFPWDVRGVASGVAAMEIGLLWILVIVHRRRVAAFFREHSKNRLLQFNVIFVLAFVVLSGMALGNLGLIARQRVLMFPFIFMFFAGTASFTRISAGRSPDEHGSS